MAHRETFAERLARFRAERKWTQADLAERAGVSQETISRYEGGHMEPRLDTVRALAKAFGVDAGALL